MNAPAKVNEAWLAGAMPLRGLVRHKASGQAFFIVKVCATDILVWDAVEIDKGVFAHNTASRQLQRKLVLDLDGWEEIVTDVWSMMRCFAKVGAPW